MKTILIVAVLFLVLQGGLGGSTASSGKAPEVPTPPPQSGGGDTFNTVLGLISAGINAAAGSSGKQVNLAQDRNSPATV